MLAAITLIFFYLAYVVLPLFQGAELTAKKVQSPAWLQQDAGKPLLLTIEEQNQVGMRISDKGEAVFFATKDGAELKRTRCRCPPARAWCPSARTSPAARWWPWASPMARCCCSSTAMR